MIFATYMHEPMMKPDLQSLSHCFFESQKKGNKMGVLGDFLGLKGEEGDEMGMGNVGMASRIECEKFEPRPFPLEPHLPF